MAFLMFSNPIGYRHEKTSKEIFEVFYFLLDWNIYVHYIDFHKSDLLIT